MAQTAGLSRTTASLSQQRALAAIAADQQPIRAIVLAGACDSASRTHLLVFVCKRLDACRQPHLAAAVISALEQAKTRRKPRRALSCKTRGPRMRQCKSDLCSAAKMQVATVTQPPHRFWAGLVCCGKTHGEEPPVVSFEPMRVTGTAQLHAEAG